MIQFCPVCGQPDNCGDCDHTPVPPEEIYWEHEMIEHPDPPEEREGYLPDDKD
jgi:hypothetical protein